MATPAADKVKWRKVIRKNAWWGPTVAELAHKLECYYYKAAVNGDSVYIYGTDEDRKCAINVILEAPNPL